MKRYIICGFLFSLFALLSCTDDTSAYEPQVKEPVDVDNVDNEQGDNETEDEELPDGELVPGIHLVKINVTQPDGQVVERRFKYYMPISVDTSKPISLIFEFHGSYTFDTGVKPSDPLRDISVGHTLIQHAIKENCVVCFPAGTVEMQEDGSGAVNRQYSEKHLPFVDAMIDYFRGRTPSVDMNRVYSTGQSSGAIFSFVLAYERPEVFAAITPRAGQMSLAGAGELPKRAVPVRVFAGVADETVVHSAVLANMTDWAEKIGGYFASDMVLVEDSIEIENYKVVDVRYWTGGKADYQIYSLKEEGHGISISYCMPYMWEFMASHTLDGNTDNLFVTSSIKEIEAQCGQTIEFDVNYTEGATLEISQPKGWELEVTDKHVVMRAPTDFFGAIARQGDITLTATLNGQNHVVKIPFNLSAPKNYFEVGDIYYNEAFEPIGVIYWVNEENIKEGMAISLKQCSVILGELPADFDTPDMNNGYINTQSVVEKNESDNLGLTASNSAFIWAAQYGGETGWYIPSIGEMEEFSNNKETINALLTAAGGKVLPTAYSISSTTVLNNGGKTYYEWNFSGKYISKETRMYSDPGFAIKKVTKK